MTIAIVAGGKSTRMGSDKAFVRLAGKPLLRWLLERLLPLNVSHMLLIANRPAEDYAALLAEVSANPGNRALIQVEESKQKSQPYPPDPSPHYGEGESKAPRGETGLPPAAAERGWGGETKSTTIPIYPDVLPGTGSLGGIYSALFHSQTEYTLVLACDMPFVNPALINYILSRQEQAAAIVPRVQGYPQAFHALYRRDDCLPVLLARLQAHQLKAGETFQALQTVYLDEKDWMPFDETGLSFFNVNTIEDLNYAHYWIETKKL